MANLCTKGVFLYLQDWTNRDSSKTVRWRRIMSVLSVRVWQVQSCKKLRGKQPAVASRASFVWVGPAGKGTWRSPSFFIPWQNLLMQSCTVNARSEAFLISGAVNEHWFTSLEDKSTLWPSVNKRIWFFSDSHRCHAELPSFKPLVFLGEKVLWKIWSIGKISSWVTFCGAEIMPLWMVCSFLNMRGPTARKNLALVMKCQCSSGAPSLTVTGNLQVVCFTYCWIWRKWIQSLVHNFFEILSGPSQAVSSNECKWKLWLSISKQSVASHHWHRTLFIQLISASDADA